MNYVENVLPCPGTKLFWFLETRKNKYLTNFEFRTFDNWF